MPKPRRCRCQDPNAVAILARISDREKQGQASIEQQLRQARELLVEPRGWHVVAEYQVRHRGSDLSRDPTYMAMICDARAGKFARLCLHKFDRFARRAYDREVFEHILTRECGIELHAALEPYDLKTRAGKLTKKTSAFISDIFLDNLAEETMKGMVAKVTSGGWVARAPFGYINKREEIGHNKFRRWVEVDPAAEETVRLIFRLFSSGQHTLDTLTDWLNDHGHLWQRGLPWRRDRVHRLLLNPFYVGRILWNGLEAQGVHEPLVDPTSYERCRAILREHDQDRERRKRHVYALNRLLHWVDLGCGSHAEYQAHVDIAYYRSIKPGIDGTKICLPCADIDGQIPRILVELTIPVWMHAEIRQAYRREVRSLAAPSRSEAARRRQRLEELEAESRGYIRLLAQGKISEAEFDVERERVLAAIATVRSELVALERGGVDQLNDLDAALLFSARLGELWETGDASRRKLLAHLLFKRIDMANDGTIVDVWLAPPFAYLAELKQKRSPEMGSASKQVRFGSAYRIRTGDLLLEREVS